MFGYVTANWKELTADERTRYSGVYCGICRDIKARASQTARLTLSYDMAFLSLLLMSLYEPEEQQGKNHCLAHPGAGRIWIDNEYVRYGADMNVALSYYKCLDDWQDDHRHSARLMAKALKEDTGKIAQRYPRQCGAISDCIARLGALEQAGCSNPDEPAGCFGTLMGELLVYREDLWAPTLRQIGMALGRYIYLADAAVDYRSDKRKKKYNPFLAQGCGEEWDRWEEYLVLAMGRCTHYYEKLPLVQDKGLLDNILYSGIWVTYHGKGAKAREEA